MIPRQKVEEVLEAIWNADEYTSGIYFYRLRVDDIAIAKKMILIK